MSTLGSRHAIASAAVSLTVSYMQAMVTQTAHLLLLIRKDHHTPNLTMP